MLTVRLVDLNPRWIGCGGPGISDAAGNPVPERRRIGVSFDCPCAPCCATRTGVFEQDYRLRHFVNFSNPIDGGEPFDPTRQPHWHREGDDFETLRITPSILSDPAKGGCGWHGFIGQTVPGEVTTC